MSWAAAEDFERAIELDARSAVAWLVRGLAREQSGDDEGAVGDLTRVLELAPDGAYARSAQERLARLGKVLRDGEGERPR